MPALLSVNDIYRVRTSAKSIIKRALRLIGCLAAGEEIESGALNDGVEALNALLDSWNTEKLTVYALARTTFTLTNGLNPHEIGPAGNLDTGRPNRLEQGQVWITGGTLGTIESELFALSQEEWASIYDSSLSGTPDKFYYEPAFPLGKLWFDLKPDSAYTLILYLETMLQQVFTDTVNTELALPTGYKEALDQGLAIRLTPEYGKSAPPEVIEGAVTAKANLKRLNMRPLYMEIDPALRREKERYNIYTDNY